jgi:hypothetical protein
MAEELKPDSPIVLYNLQTGQPEGLRPGVAEEALKRGTHSVPKGSRYNVVSDSGESGSVDSSQLFDAVNQGYRIETPFEREVNNYAEENKGITGAAKAALYGLGNELTFGTGEVIADKVQSSLDVAKRQRVKDEFPVVNTLGSLVGIGATLPIAGPLFRGAGAAGKAVQKGTESLISTALSKAGVTSAKEIAESMAPQLVAKVAGAAAEGAALMSPRAAAQLAVGDPEAAAESLVLGAGIGGALKGVTGIASPGLKALSVGYKRARDSVKAPFGKGATAVENQGLINEARENIIKSSEKPRAEARDFRLEDKLVQEAEAAANSKYAQEAREWAERIGLAADDLTPDVMSRSTFVKDGVGAMSQRFTTVGHALRNKIDKQVNAIVGTTKNVLGTADVKAAEEIAMIARERATQNLQARIAQSDALYAEQSRRLGAIALTEAEVQRITEGAAEIIKKAESGANKKVRDEIAKNLRGIEQFAVEGQPMSLEVLAQQRASVNDELSKFARLPGAAEKRTRDALFELKEYFENQIEQTAKNLEVGGAGELRELAAQARQSYAALKREQEQFAELLGHRKGGKQLPSTFLSDLATKNPEQIESALAKLNSEQMRRLNAFAPDFFDVAAKIKRNDLVRVGGKEGVALQGTFNKFKELDSKIKELIFTPEARAQLEAASGLWDRVQVNFNRSKTAVVQDAGGILKHFKQEFVSDPLQYEALLKSASMQAQNKALNQTMDVAGRILSATDKAVVSILDNTNVKVLEKSSGKVGSVLSRILKQADQGKRVAEKESDDPQEMLRQFANDLDEVVMAPDKALDRLEELFGGFDGAPTRELAVLASTKMTEAASYLKEMLPPLVQTVNTFDVSEPPRVPTSEIAAFERRLETVENPGILADRLANGTLTREHVETMARVYPRLYQAMQMRGMELIADKGMKQASYPNRLKLALLLSLDTHQSLSSSAIRSLQSTGPRMAEAKLKGQMSGSPNAITIGNRQMTQDQRLQNS